MGNPLLTREYVLSRFEYREGKLYWKPRPREHFKTHRAYIQWNCKYPNQRAGFLSDRYRKISINYFRYLEHRIIFLMHYGYMPDNVDHLDGNTNNNKIENLRAATRFENLSNMKLCKRNSSGHKGVYWCKHHNRWRARLNHHNKEITVGYFEKIEDAANAIREARNKYHGQFARHE